MHALSPIVALMLAVTPAAAQVQAGGQGAVVAGVISGQAPARDNNNAVPDQPGTSTLRGRVFAADTGQPLRKAEVRINSTGPLVNGQRPLTRVAISDESGRYEFKELRAGRYGLMVQKSGYIPLQWGQQRPNDPGKQIDVLEGQTVEKVDLSLPRGGVITGRVLDEFGDPAPDVQVAAVRSQIVGGVRRLLTSGRIATTDDIGEFRLFAIAPGNYYLSATLRNSNIGLDSDSRSGYAPTYYPGTADIASAQRLTIALGQTITDLTMPLQPVRTARVSGTAVNGEGQAVRGTVIAVTASTGGPMMFATTPGPIRPDGSFVINGLTPGSYTLQLQLALQNGGGLGSGTADAGYASADITIDGRDLAGIRLVATKRSTIAGRITVVGGDANGLRPATIRVGASPALGMVLGANAPPVALNSDWTFEAKARAGLVRLTLNGLQAPWSIKSIRQRGADVTDTGVEVRAGEDVGGIEIALTNRSTDLSGLAMNSRGDPVKDYWVVFFARDAAKRAPGSRFVRIGRANQDGRFRTTGLPPGDYLAAAFEMVDTSELTDPEFLERLESRAARFTLGDGETRTLELKLSASP